MPADCYTIVTHANVYLSISVRGKKRYVLLNLSLWNT